MRLQSPPTSSSLAGQRVSVQLEELAAPAVGRLPAEGEGVFLGGAPPCSCSPVGGRSPSRAAGQTPAGRAPRGLEEELVPARAAAAQPCSAPPLALAARDPLVLRV